MSKVSKCRNMGTPGAPVLRSCSKFVSGRLVDETNSCEITTPQRGKAHVCVDIVDLVICVSKPSLHVRSLALAEISKYPAGERSHQDVGTDSTLLGSQSLQATDKLSISRISARDFDKFRCEVPLRQWVHVACQRRASSLDFFLKLGFVAAVSSWFLHVCNSLPCAPPGMAPKSATCPLLPSWKV